MPQSDPTLFFWMASQAVRSRMCSGYTQRLYSTLPPCFSHTSQRLSRMGFRQSPEHLKFLKFCIQHQVCKPVNLLYSHIQDQSLESICSSWIAQQYQFVREVEVEPTGTRTQPPRIVLLSSSTSHSHRITELGKDNIIFVHRSPVALVAHGKAHPFSDCFL